MRCDKYEKGIFLDTSKNAALYEKDSYVVKLRNGKL